MQNYKIKRLVAVALLIAMEIILSRFLSISTPIVKIGFSFLPIAIAGMLFGPLYGGITGAVGDFIGAILFPIGAYFPGFTLTAALTGVAFGILLHKQLHIRFYLRTALAVAIACIPLSLGLNTLWLWITMENASIALLPGRLIQCGIMLPVQFVTIVAMCKLLVTTGITPRLQAENK